MSEHPHDKLQPDLPTLRPGLVQMMEGPWAGWYRWEPVDHFEEHAGPFFCRLDGDGIECAFMPEAKNRNGGGNIHGGALMTFADYALFMIGGGMDTSVHGVTTVAVGNCGFHQGQPFTHHVDPCRAIDAVRAQWALTPLVYTDPIVVPAATIVRARHLEELRNALE